MACAAKRWSLMAARTSCGGIQSSHERPAWCTDEPSGPQPRRTLAGACHFLLRQQRGVKVSPYSRERLAAPDEPFGAPPEAELRTMGGVCMSHLLRRQRRVKGGNDGRREPVTGLS